MNNTDFIFRDMDFSWAMNRVVEWNKTARDGKHIVDEKTLNLQKKLVEEETKELLEAVEAQDKVEALDALCDMFVVGSYWYFLQNYDIKPKTFIATQPLLSVDYVKAAEFDCSQDSSYMFMMSTTAMLLKFEGNVRGALEEVLSSNDSKFPKVEVKSGAEGTLEGVSVGDEYVTPEEMCSWIEHNSKGRYTGVNFKIVGKGKDRRYVFLDNNGKIMKPKNFFAPDLREFV